MHNNFVNDEDKVLANSFITTISPTGIVHFELAGTTDTVSLIAPDTGAGATTAPSITVSINRIQ